MYTGTEQVWVLKTATNQPPQLRLVAAPAVQQIQFMVDRRDKQAGCCMLLGCRDNEVPQSHPPQQVVPAGGSTAAAATAVLGPASSRRPNVQAPSTTQGL